MVGPFAWGAVKHPTQSLSTQLSTSTHPFVQPEWTFILGIPFRSNTAMIFFFTDCNTGRVQRIKLMPPSYDQVGVLENFVDEGPVGTLDVKTGADGNLYYTTFDAVFRLVPPSGNASTALSGMVTRVDDEGDEKAVLGAQIVLKQRNDGKTVFKHKALTDEEGRYFFTGLPEGEYRVVTKTKGFQKEKSFVMLNLTEPMILDVVLSPCRHDIVRCFR